MVTAWARTASGTGTARISMQRQNGTATRYENVSAADATWNGAVAPGASVMFGFLAGYTGGNANPAAFTLNGVACALR